MKLKVHNLAGESVSEAELPETIFDIEPNRPVMHQALVRQLANARQGTHSTQTRAEVDRTGAKVWRQKGTGRARQGSRRAPQWVGGGQAFGPKPRDYSKRMPKKMRQLALRSTLAAKAQAGQLVLVDALTFEAPRTRVAREALDKLGVDRSVVVLTGADESEENVRRSFSNLPEVTLLNWRYLNVRDLLSHDYLVMSVAALDQITALWG